MHAIYRKAHNPRDASITKEIQSNAQPLVLRLLRRRPVIARVATTRLLRPAARAHRDAASAGYGIELAWAGFYDLFGSGPNVPHATLNFLRTELSFPHDHSTK